MVEGEVASRAFTPRGVGRSFYLESEEARLLLFFSPAGVEEFFREVVGRLARSPRRAYVTWAAACSASVFLRRSVIA